jgi:predicted dehydrogenase
LFLCGQNEQKTATAARKLRADGYFHNVHQAIRDSRVQSLVLALPHHLHRPVAEEALAHGKHVFVEKPIATSLDDADAVIRAAEEHERILMVGDSMQWRPSIISAKACIDRGDIGTPLYFAVTSCGIRSVSGWRARQDQMGGGIMIDVGVHYIRSLRLIMGEPDSVLATRAKQIQRSISAEDSAHLLFTSKAGWEANMLFSWTCNAGNLPDIVVMGDEGTIHLWPARHYYDYYPKNPPFPASLIRKVRPSWLQQKLWHPVMARERRWMNCTDLLGYSSELEAFVRAVANGRKSPIDPRESRRDLQIALGCHDSLQSGRQIPIPARREIGHHRVA